MERLYRQYRASLTFRLLSICCEGIKFSVSKFGSSVWLFVSHRAECSLCTTRHLLQTVHTAHSTMAAFNHYNFFLKTHCHTVSGRKTWTRRTSSEFTKKCRRSSSSLVWRWTNTTELPLSMPPFETSWSQNRRKPTRWRKVSRYRDCFHFVLIVYIHLIFVFMWFMEDIC